MVVQVNTRELVLQTLLEINKEGQYGHIAIRNTLEKYQYLENRKEHLLQESVRAHRRIRLKSII